MRKSPEYPFQIVAADLFQFKGNDFLVMADHYSGFMDFKQLKNSDASEVILILKEWFKDHGTPESLESDGGPQFVSHKFSKFAREWDFVHHISSPYYPRANGFAERNVQVAKNLLKKCHLDGSDVHKAMLMLRNTDRNDTLKSPAQRLFSRRTRIPFIPIAKDELQPKVIEGVIKELEILRMKQKSYADRGTRPKAPLQVGDEVMMKTGHRQWQQATVIANTEQPRSVIVKKENTEYRRNNFHLKKIKSEPQCTDNNSASGTVDTDTCVSNTNPNQLEAQSTPQTPPSEIIEGLVVPSEVLPRRST